MTDTLRPHRHLWTPKTGWRTPGSSRRSVLKMGAAAAAVGSFGMPAVLRAQPEEIEVAVIYPMSGAFARFGETVAAATLIAFEHVNQEGGIQSLGGAQIRPISVDIRSETTVTRTETERVLTDHNVAATTGCYVSGLSMIASEVCERHGVPFVTGSVSDDLTARGFQHLFQVSAKASMFGRFSVEFARRLTEQNGGGEQNRVAILYEDTDYGTSTSEGLRRTAEELGFEIVLFESYPHDIPDADPLITRVARANADIVFPVSYLQDAILFIQTMARRNVEVAVFGGGAGYLVPEFEEALGPLSNLTFSAAAWNWDVDYPGVLEINDAYVERTGEPFIHEHAGEGYAMGRLIADALERAGSADPKDVRDALAATSIEPPHPAAIMPGGRMEFDETGWNHHVSPVIIQWQDQLPRAVYPPEEARQEAVWPLPPWAER